jgi:hypothetical protein
MPSHGFLSDVLTFCVSSYKDTGPIGLEPHPYDI